MANKFQVKRTAVSGRTPNTTNSGNTHYIDTGELALNLTDGKLFSSNGSASFEVGANLASLKVTGEANVSSLKVTGEANVSTLKVTGLANVSTLNVVGDANVAGLLRVTASSGDEGGEIFLAAPANTTITNGITIDSYQNKLRFFEQGGSARGAYIDITACAGGVGTNLLAGGAGVDTTAQFTWTNNHSFSANVSFTGRGIGLTSNTSAIYLGGISDSNWRIGRNTGAITKWKYTNNSIDIVTANSTLEGMSIGLVGGNSYFETGYLGTFIASNVTIGDTSVNATINSTSFSGTANNATNLGGVAAASYVQNTDSRTLSGNLVISGTSFTPSSNTVLLGSSTQRWVVSANTGDFSGTVTGTVANMSTSVNSALLTVGTSFIANTTGAYHTGTINAASYTVGSSFISNTTGVYHTGTVNAASFTTTGFTANTTGTYPTSNSSGSALGTTTQRWVINANTINASGLLTATAGANIQGTANLVDVNISGNLTVSGTTTYVNTTNLNVGDNIVTLNADLTGATAPTENAGLEINRGSSANVNFLWNETSDSWTLGNTSVTGYVNASASVNSAILSVGASFIANTTGAYHTGTINSASYTIGSNFSANSTVVTTSDQIISTRTGSAADGDGQIYLNGGTSNRIDWAATGVGAPSVSTRSSGTKLVLYPAVAAASVDFGMGIDTNVMWSSVADTGDTFRWYANTTLLFDANTSGITVGSGGISPTSNSSATSLGSSTQRWVLNANTISASGLINGSSGLIVTGTANVSVAFNLGSSFTANTTGAYHTGTVNAASLTVGSTFVANATAVVISTPLTANATTGTSGQVLTSNGTTGAPYWATVSAGLSIGGSNTQIQFNNSGALGGDALFTYDSATEILTVGNTTVGSINLGAASPSTLRAIQVDKIYAVDSSVAGFYGNTVLNNATLTAGRAVSGVQTLTIANTQDANSTAGIQGSDAYGHLNYVYNGTAAASNARINNLVGTYNDLRNNAGGATANSVDAAYGSRAIIRLYGSGPITTAYGHHSLITPANTSVTGTITTAYGFYANVNITAGSAASIANGYLYYGSFTGAALSGTAKFGIYLTGESNNYFSANVTIGGRAYATIFSATSDERLKTNIEIIGDPVEKIKSLKGVNFTYTASNTRSIGVIAQDVEKQMPELVDINSEGYRQVNYNGIIGVLIEAVKQQQKEIDNLKQIIKNLQ
jgi:hypothetical protein